MADPVKTYKAADFSVVPLAVTEIPVPKISVSSATDDPTDPAVVAATPTTLLTSIFGNISSFFSASKLETQKEKQIRVVTKRGVRTAGNQGFYDAVFQDMMKKVGWKNGQAWCAYYIKVYLMQFYSFDAAYVNANFTGSAVGNFQTIQRNNKSGDTRYIIVTTDTPQVGDIFVYNYGAEGGHTGIVKEVINNNKIVTEEGNTTLKGVREGEGVASLTRSVFVGKAGLMGYIRRNFTDAEAARLYYDETEFCVKMK